MATTELSDARTQGPDGELLRIVQAGVPRDEVRTDHPPQLPAAMIGAMHLSTVRRRRSDPNDDVAEMFVRAAHSAAESIALDHHPDGVCR
ncbi:hypothetical protein [Rhodococcus sp. R1101]|uniref:hypothetical protein n=1 Tax=Rhodococcus sp. R1101 TaxID=1170698 RepID=UPI0002F67C68|nr:hypothetical protein [Rhodococcus sp. R1101]